MLFQNLTERCWNERCSLREAPDRTEASRGGMYYCRRGDVKYRVVVKYLELPAPLSLKTPKKNQSCMCIILVLLCVHF